MVMNLLAIDPGETAGWALFDYETGDLKDLGQCTPHGLRDILNQSLPLQELVIEDYVINPRRPHGGSRAPTIQMIGALKWWAGENGVPIYLSRSSILTTAQLHTQIRMPKNHKVSHRISAFLHGAERLIAKGIRQTALEKAMESDARIIEATKGI